MKNLLCVSTWEHCCEMVQSEAGIEKKISHKQVLIPVRCGDWRLCEFECAWPPPPPPSSTASSPPWIETDMQMNGKFTRGNYRWREGGPTCSGEGRGLSFSLSQRTVSWDGVLVACVLPMTWLREGIRGKVLFGATCGPLEGVCIQKHTFHAHFASPCLCGQLVVLFSSTRDFQSQGQHEWNSRDAVPLLPCVPSPHSAKPTSVPSPDLKSPLMPKAGCPLPPQGRTSWSPGGKQKDYVLMLVPDLFPLLQFMWHGEVLCVTSEKASATAPPCGRSPSPL